MVEDVPEQPNDQELERLWEQIEKLLREFEEQKESD